ncbi:MAG: DUF4252 domain-containing protein [Bacteroidales bacterium]|jgi:hypothetical protein
MKKVILILLAAFICPMLANAQSKHISEIFDKYEKKKHVESIVVTPSLLGFMIGGEDKEAKDLMSKIKEIRILNVPTTAIENGVPLRQILKDELDKFIIKEQFTRVVKVNSGDELLEVYISQNDKGALLFLASSTAEFAVISIFGKIDKQVVNSIMNGTLKVK